MVAININHVYEYCIDNELIDKGSRTHSVIQALEVESKRTLIYSLVFVVISALQAYFTVLKPSVMTSFLLSISIVITFLSYMYYLYECTVVERHKLAAVQDSEYEKEME